MMCKIVIGRMIQSVTGVPDPASPLLPPAFMEVTSSRTRALAIKEAASDSSIDKGVRPLPYPPPSHYNARQAGIMRTPLSPWVGCADMAGQVCRL